MCSVIEQQTPTDTLVLSTFHIAFARVSSVAKSRTPLSIFISIVKSQSSYEDEICRHLANSCEHLSLTDVFTEASSTTIVVYRVSHCPHTDSIVVVGRIIVTPLSITGKLSTMTLHGRRLYGRVELGNCSSINIQHVYPRRRARSHLFRAR